MFFKKSSTKSTAKKNAQQENLSPEMLQHAIQQHREGNFAQAQALYEQILVAEPHHPDALHFLGVLNYQLGQHAAAVALISQAIDFFSNSTAMHCNLALALQAQDKVDEAANSYENALVLEPNHLTALQQLGHLFAQQQQPEAAIAKYQAVLALNPDDAQVLNNLGCLFKQQGKLTEAAESFQQLLILSPHDAIAHCNLGIVLQEQHNIPAAITHYRQAILLNPEYAESYYNLGVALKEQNQLDAAIESFQRAIAVNPNYADAHWNFALTQLSLGNFALGFQEYVWRDSLQVLKNQTNAAAITANLIHEADEIRHFQLDGATITLIKDQGLGDELFFLRFASLLKKRGVNRVSYLSDPRLAAMIRRAQCVDEVFDQENRLASEQVKFSVGDLPLLLQINHEREIPPPLSIPVLADKVREIATRLAPYRALTRPLIGVTWRGGTPNNQRGIFKEISPAQLGTALQEIEATFIILQRLPEACEIAAFTEAVGQPVLDCSDLNHDLEGMLALLAELDDYVGVSNTNMHLRASVGKTAQVLVPTPEFRWLAHGHASPWFPGFHLYRADHQHWDAALAALKTQLMLNNTTF